MDPQLPKPSESFPLKVESLEVRMKVSSHPNLKYIGPRVERPEYRPLWEWFRTRVLRLRPHWRPLTFRDLFPDGLSKDSQ